MTNYGVSATGETAAIYEGLDEAFTAASGFIGESPDGVPKAYIQCLVFDADYNDITPDDGHQVITSAALGDASDPEILTLDIAIEEDGYVFIYVTNESLDAYVNFDDISVSISGYEITEMTDYYPFGSIANHWGKEEESYRFRYQGQFAEEDEETGFNHFEARDYDPIIGRWMVVDPARQHASPFLSMGNNPINKVDPDGREDDPVELSNVTVTGRRGVWNRVKNFFSGAPDLPFNPVYRASALGYQQKGGYIRYNGRAEYETRESAIAHSEKYTEDLMQTVTAPLYGFAAAMTMAPLVEGGITAFQGVNTLYFEAGMSYLKINTAVTNLTYNTLYLSAPILGRTKLGKQIIIDLTFKNVIEGNTVHGTGLKAYEMYKNLMKGGKFFK